MTTQVPVTQDEAMPDAHTIENSDAEDIIVGKDDLVIRAVSTRRTYAKLGLIPN